MTTDSAANVEAWNTVLFEKWCRYKHLITVGMSRHGETALDRHPVPVGGRVLDVGCGTGALTAAICEVARPGSVVACDPSVGFVGYARANTNDARVSFEVAGAGLLPTRPDGFDCITSSFALNFFPDPEAGVSEMRDAAAPGGVVSACVWDYAGKMEFLRYFWDAVAATDPAAANMDEGTRFPICHRDALTDLFRNARLHDVVCDAIEIPTHFDSFDAFWLPFLGGAGPAPSYVVSLDDKARETLCAEIRRSLPNDAGGGIPLIARAWAVRGVAA